MINREVMELMNRYLDGDLDERELAELERHLQQSPEAAAMFERLKRLHLQLEQLPMVTPPTSIVDAILPRLDQIGAGSEHAAADNAPARRSGRFRPNRSFAGAAAAAVLLLAVALPSGIALLNRQSAYEMEASSAGASLNSALMMSGQEIASKTEEQNAFTAQFSLKVADQSGSPDGGAHPEMSAGGASGPPEGGVPDGRSGGSGAPETVDKSLPVMEGSQPGKAALGFTGPMEPSPDAGERTIVTDYAEGKPPAGWQVAVEAGGDGLRVYVLDERGETVFISPPYPGDITHFRWSEDGGTFSFDHEHDGKTERVTVDVGSGTILTAPGSP